LWSPFATLLSPGVRFLLLNQFYPPDGAPTGRMLHDLATALAARGHDVQVICSRLGYDGSARVKGMEMDAGVEIQRTGGLRFRRRTVVGRVAAYGAFLVGALRAALAGPSPDTVVSLTTPPFLGLVGAAIARARKSRHAHWTMDVYPDALRAHWPGAGNRVLWPVLEWLGRAQYRGAALVVAPGPCVENRLRRWLPRDTALRSVPLWATTTERADPAECGRERASRGWKADDFVLMYSGNMGLGHRFSEFLEAARQLSSSGPRWVFVGDGPRRREIEVFRAANPSARIELSAYVDGSRLAASLASADIHLVSVAPGWEGVMVPSKLQNVFAAGRPVIYLGPAATDVANWIRDSGGGWIVAPGDLPALLLAVEEARDPEELLKRGGAALEFARRHFDREQNCAEMVLLLEQC
jgi:colanic acid biosynthesis glycosyl transferase WcaI